MGGRGVRSLKWLQIGSARRAFLLVALVLLGASFEARGEGRPAAPSANGNCSVAADAQRWTKQEIFVWERVCAGAIADFNEGTAYGGDLDPNRPEGLPESRILRSKFLETILLEDKYRRVLTRRGVRIIGARFRERIDLVNAELKHELWLNRCLLEQGADFSGAKSTHLLSFDGAKVTGKFDMDSSRIDESVNMRKARFSDITMASAHIGDMLELNETTVTGQLYMGNLRVESSLLMRDAHFGEAVLGSAHIGGTLELDNSTVSRRLYMDKLQVDSSLSMRKAKLADVNLTSVHVGGQLQMHEAGFGNLQCYNLAVDQDALLHNSHFTGKIDCPFSKFRNLYFDNSIFDDDVNLTSGQIGGELQFGSPGRDSAHWNPGKSLILRNARAETIPMLTDAWPARVDLNGFSYRTLRDDSPLSHKQTSECPSGPLQCWFGKQKSFSPQPYEQLALVFQNQGYADDARAIRLRRAGTRTK